jgi:hypothetical protein
MSVGEEVTRLMRAWSWDARVERGLVAGELQIPRCARDDNS